MCGYNNRKIPELTVEIEIFRPRPSRGAGRRLYAAQRRLPRKARSERSAAQATSESISRFRNLGMAQAAGAENLPVTVQRQGRVRVRVCRSAAQSEPASESVVPGPRSPVKVRRVLQGLETLAQPGCNRSRSDSESAIRPQGPPAGPALSLRPGSGSPGCFHNNK